MSKPINYISLEITYKKSTYIFEFPTLANNENEFNDSSKYYIVKKITSSKNLRNKYIEIFSKCKIINFKIIKQIGTTSN